MDGERVYVYWNRHFQTFSIRDCKSGRVVTHRDRVWLRDGEFRVSQAGRLRVLRTGRRNVHAGVVGTLLSRKPRNVDATVSLHYNPYRAAAFTTRRGQAVKTATYVMLADGAAWIPQDVRLESRPKAG